MDILLDHGPQGARCCPPGAADEQLRHARGADEVDAHAEGGPLEHLVRQDGLGRLVRAFTTRGEGSVTKICKNMQN